MKEKRKKNIQKSREFSKIMVVDDEKKLLLAVEKYLTAKQFKIIVCNSAKEALNKLKGEQIDLLIVDILMSDMNGYELISYVKKNPRISCIPFIFLTAKGMTKDRIKGFKIGCKAYLGKPFDPEELVAIIDNILLDEKSVNEINHIKNEVNKIRKKIHNSTQVNRNIRLTKRETDVLIAVSKGLSNKDIANNLKMSVRNVENYVTRLLDKTKLNNRVKLANYKYFVSNQGE